MLFRYSYSILQQPGTAAYEMRRVTRARGTVAACTWDKTGQEMSDLFWEECVRLDPGAEEKAQRPKVCNLIGQLSELWRATGLEGVEEMTLEMRTDFTCFDDFWLPYTKWTQAKFTNETDAKPTGSNLWSEFNRIALENGLF